MRERGSSLSISTEDRLRFLGGTACEGEEEPCVCVCAVVEGEVADVGAERRARSLLYNLYFSAVGRQIHSLYTLPEARRVPTYLRILLDIIPPRLPPFVGSSKGFLPCFELSADLFALGVSICIAWLGDSGDGHGCGADWWDVVGLRFSV